MSRRSEDFSPAEVGEEGEAVATRKNAVKQEERERLLTQAYGAATKRLRDEYRSEFNSLYEEEAAQRGVEWHPKLTAEQKAEQEFDALLAAFPYLAERVPVAGE